MASSAGEIGHRVARRRQWHDPPFLIPVPGRRLSALHSQQRGGVARAAQTRLPAELAGTLEGIASEYEAELVVGPAGSDSEEDVAAWGFFPARQLLEAINAGIQARARPAFGRPPRRAARGGRAAYRARHG